MTVHPDQDDTNWNCSLVTCRVCVQLPLYVDVIDASIDTQMLKSSDILLVHFAALDNGRKADIVTLKKDKVYIFSECCDESFKENFLRCVNKILFWMV